MRLAQARAGGERSLLGQSPKGSDNPQTVAMRGLFVTIASLAHTSQAFPSMPISRQSAPNARCLIHVGREGGRGSEIYRGESRCSGPEAYRAGSGAQAKARSDGSVGAGGVGLCAGVWSAGLEVELGRLAGRDRGAEGRGAREAWARGLDPLGALASA